MIFTILQKGLVINYEEGGGGALQNTKLFGSPPPSRQGKLFTPPLLKSGKFLAKTSCYCVKTTPKLVVPLLQHGQNFFSPNFS